MTLDETIIHAEEQAERLEESARGCDLTDKVEKEIACKLGKCAAEHRQLAEWLKELREYKQQNVPDIHVGKTDFKPGEKFILELGAERKMFGEFEIAGTDLYVKTSLLEKLTRYEPGTVTNCHDLMDDLLSREEVIKAIEDEWDGCLGEYNSACIIRDTCEAIDRVASAQPEIKTDGDMISRRVAIDAIMSLVNFDTVKELRQYCDSHLAAVWSDGIRDAIDAIEDVDSTQPERKTGRWIDDHCSECGQYVFHEDVRNFCPNCGAKMLKEGE